MEEVAMTTSRRWMLNAGLIGGFAACFGCNPFLFPLFLQGEAMEPATLKRLVSEDKNKEVAVAIVVSGRLNPRQELLNVNRELSRKTAEQLRALAKTRGEKLSVIEPSKVERYLANHPKWRDMEPEELASALKE